MRLMSGRPIVPPEGFARTSSPKGYENGWKQSSKYFDLLEYMDANPTASRTEAAKEMGLSNSIVRRWLSGEIPRIVENLFPIDELGWTSSHWRSPLGHAFNIFIAGVNAVGSFPKNASSPRIRVPESKDEQTVREIVTVVETIVGSAVVEELKQTKGGGGDIREGEVIQPGEHGTLLSHALQTTGVPQTPQNRPGYSLPEHLEIVSPELRKEFVEAFIVLRGSEYPDRKKRDIRFTRPQSYIEELAQLFEEVTGVEPSVRETGIYLPVSLVEGLDLEMRVRERFTTKSAE